MPRDATFFVQHTLTEQEIQNLCDSLEHQLLYMGIYPSNIIVHVTEDTRESKLFPREDPDD